VATASERAPSHEDTGWRVRRTFERALRAGEIVFDEGEPGDHLYVIQSGEIELTRSGGDGARVVSRYGPGEFFGEMGVLLGRPRTARATAACESRVLELDGPTFEAMCVDHPEIAIRVIQRLASRTIELEQRLATLGADDLLRPVVRLLVRWAEPAEGEYRVATTLRALAVESGVRLGEAHRALGQLFDRKLVRLVDDELRIADLEALSAVLDVPD
jgi:CRP/FNR family cyclic AMP-dependent transcriptional regulator